MTKEYLRKLAEEATPGPWRTRWYGSGGYEGREGVTVVTDTGSVSCQDIAYLGRGDLEEDTAQRSRNGKYIAAVSPSVILGLLDRVAELEAELFEARDVADDFRWKLNNNIRGCQCSDDEACAHVRRADAFRTAGERLAEAAELFSTDTGTVSEGGLIRALTAWKEVVG